MSSYEELRKIRQIGINNNIPLRMGYSDVEINGETGGNKSASIFNIYNPENMFDDNLETKTEVSLSAGTMAWARANINLLTPSLIENIYFLVKYGNTLPPFHIIYEDETTEILTGELHHGENVGYSNLDLYKFTPQTTKKVTSMYFYCGENWNYIFNIYEVSIIALENTISSFKKYFDSAFDTIDGYVKTVPLDDPPNLNIPLTYIRDLFSPSYSSSSITSANNTSGLSLSLDIGGRPFVELYYSVSASATINIYGSSNGITWRKTTTMTIPSAEEKGVVFNTGFKYIKVESPTIGIDITFEVSATR